MNLPIAVLALLLLIEAVGRFLYPLNREARSKREAGRDHRLGLSYLGAEGDSRAVVQDLYLLEKRYLPFLGWIAAPNARLATIETNAQGFRDKIIGPRMDEEYRILITGGSFAWGLGASCNATTIAGQLESLLNKCEPAKRYRVMNGAFMNWTSRHEYVVVTEFFDIFDPDLVISLSGYNDLVALSKGIEIDELPEARLLVQAVNDHLQPTGTLRSLRKLAGTLGVWRIFVLLRELRSGGLPPQQNYKYDPLGGPRRVECTAQRYLSIADYIVRKRRRYLIAMEPEIYSSKKALRVEEFDLKSRFLELDKNLSSTLIRYRHELINRLAARGDESFQLLDLAGVFDDEGSPVFIDYNHVCDLGNHLTALALVKPILAISSA
jgi:hypothetical protein